MSCFDFQGTYDNTWFPTGGSSTPLEQIESINVDEGDSIVPVQGDNNTRAKSFTISSSNTSLSLTDSNLEQALTVVNGGVMGVYSFKSDDKCQGGSGKTVTVTVEEVLFDSRSTPWAVQTSSKTSRSAQAGSSGKDGETNPVTYTFSV